MGRGISRANVQPDGVALLLSAAAQIYTQERVLKLICGQCGHACRPMQMSVNIIIGALLIRPFVHIHTRATH